MPFTSKRLRVSDPFDPIENIEEDQVYQGTPRHIRRGLTNTIAAYNAGPAAVRKYAAFSLPGDPPLCSPVMDLYGEYSEVE